MGARPNSYKKSGGKLNGVVATITGYRFSDEFPAKGGGVEAWEPGKIKTSDGEVIDRPHNYNLIPSFRVEGTDTDVADYLPYVNADQFEVSEDELTLTPSDEGASPSEHAKGSKFIASLCEAGVAANTFDPEELPADDEPINLEAIVGLRVKLEQRPTGKKRKVKDKKTGKAREFDVTDLVVSEVYGRAEAPAKTAGKGVNAAAGKSKAKPVVEEEEEDNTTDPKLQKLVDDTLTKILRAAKGNKQTKQELSFQFLNGLKGNPLREEARKLVSSEAYLEDAVERELIAYDKAKRVVSLA